MRKLILIAAMSLIATQAFAGGSRSLSLAATNPTEQTAATQPATTTQPAVTATTAPTTTPLATPPAPQVTPPKPTRTTAASKAKHREVSDEARLIRELHRHGVYW
jgi:hypothetical protein